MYSLVHKIRKSYAKLTQMWNESENEMYEWAKRDPESYSYFCYINNGGGFGVFALN